MTSKLLFRLAAGVLLLHNVGHMAGHIGWKNTINPVEKKAVEAMLSNRFVFMGRLSSYGQFYEGYGHACTLALLLVAALLWIFSMDNFFVKPAMVACVVFLCGWGVMELLYFFPLAAGFTFLAILLCGIGVIKHRY